MATRTHFALSFLLLIALLLAACGGATPASTPVAAPQGEQPAAGAPATQPAVARIGWGGSPDTLNPGAATLAEAYTIFELVYSSMYELNLDGSYSPDLAKSVEVSDDGVVWTFTIRDDFQWHDGRPVTARDVAFTYQFYQKHDDFPFMPAYTGYFDTIEDYAFDIAEANRILDEAGYLWRMQEILHRDVAYIVPYSAKATQTFRTDRFRGWITDQPTVALEDPTSLTVIEPVGN